MIAATRRWFRRNRTNLVVGAGVLGATYLTGHYVVSKIQEASQRMTEQRVAKEKYALGTPGQHPWGMD
jgi:peroxin-3